MVISAEKKLHFGLLAFRSFKQGRQLRRSCKPTDIILDGLFKEFSLGEMRNV